MKSLTAKKKFLDGIFTDKVKIAVLLACVLLLLSIVLKVGLPLRGKDLMFYAYDLFFLGVWVSVLLRIIKRRDEEQNVRAVVLFMVVFTAYFLLMAAYRFYTTRSINNVTVLIRPLLWAVGLYALLAMKKEYHLPFAYGLVLFITCVNLYQLVYLVFFTKTIRDLPIYDTINVNIMVQAMGFLFLYLLYTRERGESKAARGVLGVLLLFNMVCLLITTIGSGTRLLFPVIFIEMVGLVVFNAGTWVQKLIRIGLIGAAVVLVVLSMLNFDLFNSQENVYRTFSYVKQSAIQKAIFINDIDGTGGANQGKPNAGNAPSPTKPASTKPQPSPKPPVSAAQSPERTVQVSDQMRSILWSTALEGISKNVLTGQGDINLNIQFADKDYPGGIRKTQQAPHNFVLEVLLSQGVMGLVLYMVLVFAPVIYVFMTKNSVRTKMNVALAYFVIFVPSLFQPLITTKLLLAVLFWAAMAFVPHISMESRQKH